MVVKRINRLTRQATSTSNDYNQISQGKHTYIKKKNQLR